jgi:outer membrane protein assembly factor BamB
MRATLCTCLLGFFAVLPVLGQTEPVLPGTAGQAGDTKLAEQLSATLTDARVAVANKQWEAATTALRKVLDASPGVLVPVRAQAGAGKDTTHWFSPHAAAAALVAALPPEGLAAYRQRSDAAAAELLKKARANKDAEQLARVAQQFPQTAAGHEALRLLAEQHAAAGRHLESALCLDRLLRQTHAAKLPAKLLVQAAAAYRRAGDKASADRLAKQLPDVLKNDPAGLKDAEAEVERIPIPAVHTGALFRGNAARNGHDPAGAGEVKAAQWARPVLLDKSVFDEVEKGKEAKQWLTRALQQGKRPLLSGSMPLAVGDVAVYRTHLTVTAVALQDFHDKANDNRLNPGEIYWKSIDLEGGLAGLLADFPHRQEVDRWLQYYDRPGDLGFVYENSLTGTLSSDGQFVYAIDDLGVPPPPPHLKQLAVFKDKLERIRPLIVQNTLQAFNLRSGKLMWQLHNHLEENDPFHNSHWLGAPLPLGGALYALNETNDGELRLVCLEPATGKVLSVRPLATAQEKFWQDPNRRTQACHLSYADGVLLCPTNAGKLLAVDLATQTPLWAYTYRPVREPDPAKLKLTRPNWHGSAPILHDGRVLYAAPDDAHLHCLDLRDGKLLWRVKQADDRLVAGVVGDRVVLVGAGHCRALRLKDGGELWKVEIDEPTGVGVLGADGLLLQPVRGKTAGLWTIDTAKGQVVARQEQPEVQGNLLRHGGRLLSQSPTRVSALPLSK